MAVIEERKQEDGKTSYRARVRLKGYPPKSATFDRKTDAARWAQRVEADMRSGRYFPDTHAKKHTVTDLIEIYLDDLQGRNPKRCRDVKRLLQWWKDEIGYLMLSDFKSEHALKGQQKLCKQERKRKGRNGEPVFLSPAYVNRHTVALHTAIDFGVKKLKWISHNPVSDIDKMKEPKGRTRFLSEDEIDRLVEACKSSENPFLLTIVLLGISTGARRGEVERMKWADVDKNVTQIVLPDTKNGEIRTVPLGGIVQTLIMRLKDKKAEKDVFLFPSPNNPKKSIDFRHAWEFALAKAGIENFRFHDLRHSCASYLAMNGANAIEIADMAQAAENREAIRKNFACTLVLLIARGDENIIVHIGDGAIVGRDQAGEWKALTWPENGEYASSTYFITDDPEPRVRFVEGDKTYTAYALFSDGIEDLALDQKAITAHAPFFTSMIRSVDELSGEGKDRNLSAALATFLDSDRVCERTDDDKSLILLSAA